MRTEIQRGKGVKRKCKHGISLTGAEIIGGGECRYYGGCRELAMRGGSPVGVGVSLLSRCRLLLTLRATRPVG